MDWQCNGIGANFNVYDLISHYIVLSSSWKYQHKLSKMNHKWLHWLNISLKLPPFSSLCHLVAVDSFLLLFLPSFWCAVHFRAAKQTTLIPCKIIVISCRRLWVLLIFILVGSSLYSMLPVHKCIIVSNTLGLRAQND